MCREQEFFSKKKTHVQLYNAVVCLSFFGFVPSAGVFLNKISTDFQLVIIFLCQNCVTK